KDAEPRAQSVLGGAGGLMKTSTLSASSQSLATTLQASLDGALDAYYPLDSTFVAPFESLMIEPNDGLGELGVSRRAAAPPTEDSDGKKAMLGRLASEDLGYATQEAFKKGFRFYNPL